MISKSKSNERKRKKKSHGSVYLSLCRDESRTFHVTHCVYNSNSEKQAYSATFIASVHAEKKAEEGEV